MAEPEHFRVVQLTQNDLGLMHGLLQTFGDVFNERDTYLGKPPDASYTKKLLASECFIALVAVASGQVVAGRPPA